MFARVKRAPERLARPASREIPGVQRRRDAQSCATAVLDVDGFEEPVIGQLVSMPERREPLLNRLALRARALAAPGRPDEVVLSEPFAEVHGLDARRSRCARSSTAAAHARRWSASRCRRSTSTRSAPGALMPDDQRFGVLWMGREALAAAYDLDGAFNDV